MPYFHFRKIDMIFSGIVEISRWWGKSAMEAMFQVVAQVARPQWCPKLFQEDLRLFTSVGARRDLRALQKMLP
jgi:hypothetical protein